MERSPRAGVLAGVALSGVMGCSITPRSDGLETASAGDETSENEPADTDPDPGGTTASGDTGGPLDGTGDSQDSDDGDDGDDGDDVKFDTPGGDDGPLGPGCSKIDFLFVVDNSGSMEDEQNQLVASFPEFFATIEQTVTAQDFHILVATTDGAMVSSSGSGMSSVTSCNGDGHCVCAPAPDCCTPTCQGANATTCFGTPCGQVETLSECDIAQGAGRRMSPQGACDFENAERYITGADGNLEDAFACASDVGTYGSGNEIPMEVMLAATSPELNGPDGCNEGFVRDDAVLVVTFITDEEDDNDGFLGSEGDPDAWYAQLIAHKNDQPEAVVVLGLFGDNDLPDGICAPLADGVVGAEPSPRLRAFVDAFGERGIFGSVCETDYAPFFEQAVGLIDVTCDEYEPEG